MDNFEVVAGDSVHDLVFGPGKVDRLVPAENKFWVTYGNRNESYDNNGNGRFGLRTLFWYNPIITPPPKNPKAWDKVSAIAIASAKILGDI